MNNTFNINRFGLLLRRQWLDFGRIYLIFLAVLTGAIALIFFMNVPIGTEGGDKYINMYFRNPLFGIGGFFFISIAASGYFAVLGQKSRAILELMTPASTFEKFLAGVVYSALLSIISFLLIFFLVDLTFTAYLNSTFGDVQQTGSSETPVNGTKTLFEECWSALPFLKFTFAIPFLVTSVFLLGSVYFNRFHYIKTGVTLMLFSAIAGYIIARTGSYMMDGMIRIGGPRFSDLDGMHYMFLTTLLLTLIFWFITYIRLKEKEV